MKSKNTKIQILMKGMAIILVSMFMLTPIAYATTSLDDSYLESSLLDQLLYGKIGSTAKEIEEYFNSGETTLYITNETQLRALAEYVNNGNDCLEKEIILLNDIEVDTENEWIPIGIGDKYFNGTFDGRGYTIIGATYLRGPKIYEDLRRVGLFGTIGSNGIVRNLITENFNINIFYTEDDNMENIEDINAYYHSTGNIAGYCNGTIENCINKSNISGTFYVGGIVGTLNNGTIKNCSNIGKVKGYDRVGGIAGWTTGAKSTIKNCKNTARINGSSTNVAGIVGAAQAEENDITNCLNEGNIAGKSNIGGIVGASVNDIKIDYCTNSGAVKATGHSAGGIIGIAVTENKKAINIDITNNINTGNVNADGDNAGGIAAHVSGGNFLNNYNSGSIKTSNDNAGGIIGYVGGEILSDILNAQNCLNIATVSGHNMVGGIIGQIEMDETQINVKKCTCNPCQLYYYGEDYGILVGKSPKTISITPLADLDITTIGYTAKEAGANISEEIVANGEFGETTVTYTIYNNGEEIKRGDYFNAGDIIKVVVTFDKYLAKSYGPLTAIDEAPVLKLNNSIEMVAGKINPDESNYSTIIDYTYTVKDGDNFNITSLDLSNIKGIYAVESEDYDVDHDTYTEPESISINSVSTEITGITVDTTRPAVNTKIYVENILETERYSAGKEILFEVTTTERIQGTFEVPEIQVSFSESGIGKYNYDKETGKEGYAKCIDSKIGMDGKTTWLFSYQVQEFDEGYVSVEYKAGEIEDLAGNITNLSETYTPEQADKTNLKQDGIKITKVEILKADKKTLIDANEYISGKIYVRVYVDPINLYSDINTKMNKETAPDLFLNGAIKQSNITKIDFQNSYIEYEFNTENISKLIEISMVSLINKVDLYTEDQLVSNAIPVGAQTDYEIDSFYIDEINFVTKESVIYADTTAPAVIITPNVQNSLTKEETVTYEIKWSEKLKEFTKEDITVNNGEITELSEATVNENGEYVYTATVKTSIEDGNVGDLQVIIEENACQDLVALGNVRTESVIRVDRKAAILQTLEAYAESGIKLNSEIDVVKEYYKTGEKITVVATFDENITSEKVPELVLQFSESGNSVIPQGIIDSNKIIYTYTIAEGDEGTVSVRAFNGTVRDAAGNETKVVRKSLDGNTIIVDTKVPSLNELNVTTAAGTYNAGKTITIEAIYDENVYALKDNEIKNITSETAPTFMITFINEDAISKDSKGEVKFDGYGQTEGKEDKTKLVYTYTVVGEEIKEEEVIEGDNGKLEIKEFVNSEKAQVCDIAGNTSENTPENTPENINTKETIADTIAPKVDTITADVPNPTVSGTDKFYKAGNVIEIIVNYTEPVHEKILDTIKVAFSDETPKDDDYQDVSIIEWKEDVDTIKYTYEIKDGDNGYLYVKIPDGVCKDAAGNENIGKAGEKITQKEIYADTINPDININTDITITQDENNGQIIRVEAKFNEKVFDLINNNISKLDPKVAPEILYGFVGSTDIKTQAAKAVNGDTIVYEVEKEDTISGDFYAAYFKGNLYDRAGNEFYKVGIDTTAPVLEKVEITSNAKQPYNPYCKEGTKIYVIATFDEPINAENMKLKAKVGEKEIAELLVGQVVAENKTKVKFTYEVQKGDNGVFNIEYDNIIGDIFGEKDSEITEENADNTYGWVADEYGNKNKIYSFSDEGVKPTGEAEADTENPYIESIVAQADGKELDATYTRKNAEEQAVITVDRTNADIVEYIVTYNEEVPYKHLENLEKITITNGKIIERKAIDKYSYKIVVQTTVEGVQSLIINEATVEDKAGNTDKFVRFNGVTTDFTKPTVRFISEYNGGVYVLPTNIDKVEIRPNVEISEDIANIKYSWDNDEDEKYVEVDNYSSSSDIAVPTKAFTEAGTHTLYIKVTDLAGNVTKASKTYEIINAYIGISTNITEITNTKTEPIIATVTFDKGVTEDKYKEDKYKVLTDNRKVTFKAEGSQEIVELNAAGVNEYGTQYDIWTNGTIYAEATDRVGNKVFTEHPITNIDNDAPEITFDEYYLTTLVNKEIEVGISLNESAKISYSWDNTTWEETKENVIFLDITKTFTEVGKYKLYVKAIDEAQNESSADIEIEVTNLSFTVFGNATDWTSNNVELYVYCEEELASITVNGQSVNTEDRTYCVTANGEYEFVVTDKYGNSAVAIDSKGNVIEGNKIIVDKIDKEGPTIEKTEVNGKDITITAKDDKSGLREYAITKSTEEPVEWSTSNVIKVTEDGTFYVWVKDNVGNITVSESPIVVDTIALELEITGNVTDWTNQNVELVVKANKALSSLKMGETQIDLANPKVVIEENGDYEFVATDLNGNETKQTVKVTKIDKNLPVISEVVNEGKDITITATDEASGVKEYAITSTTEEPVEWSKSNVIKVAEDGTFYVWVKDNAGNVSRAENVIVVDTTAPTVTFNYLSQTVTVGMPVEANVVTNEDAIISYSWDKETWVSSEELISRLTVSEKTTTPGKYTLYVKAKDATGNESKVQTLEFEVTTIEEIKQPDIIFEDIPTVQVNGARYVKISSQMTTELLTDAMNKEALCGKTPEYINLTEDGKIRTGTEITINGKTKYIVVVNGDVDGDGKVTFLGDIVKANDYRIGIGELTTIQLLAGDINNNGKIEFISDIVAMNDYRLGIINSL